MDAESPRLALVSCAADGLLYMSNFPFERGLKKFPRRLFDRKKFSAPLSNLLLGARPNGAD